MQLIKDLFKKFRRNRKNNYLGLDIGSYSIKLAEISYNQDIPVLQSFGQAKTFENTIINKIINDTALLKSNFQNLVNNLQPLSNMIFYALPYELTIFGNFSLPNPEALQEIEKEINNEIPYKLEDVYYSYFIFPEKDNFKVYFLVAKKDNMDRLKDILHEVNYSIVNINADFIILHNFIEYLYGPEEKAIIDWGNEKVKIHFTNKDTPFFTRELFKLGFKHIKNEIINQLKLTPDIAEKYLHKPPEDDKGLKVKEIYIKYIKQLGEEIKTSVDLVQRKFNINPSVYYLIGGGALIPGIHKLLSSLLKVEFKEIRIEEKIKISENIDPDYLKIINTKGVLAVATAMEEFI
ncbi:MAG: pilus assembly protein PilM [bacterium]